MTLSACSNTANPAPVSTDLNDDALLAPSPPELSIQSATGRLTLAWQGIEGYPHATVYRYDSLTGIEDTANESMTSLDGLNTLAIASNTHLTAWHRQQYRVELCKVSNCLSSARISIASLAENTIQQLTPSVYLRNERYGEHISSNTNASLLAIALPVEGAIELLLRNGYEWTVTQRVKLASLSASISRKIRLSSSESGDTLAVLISDENQTSQIRLLERLGETWIETASLTVPVNTASPLDGASQRNIDTTLTAGDLFVSDDENSVYFRQGSHAFIYQRGAITWPGTASYTVALGSNESNSNTSSSRIYASATDSALKRIHNIEFTDNQLWLNSWELTNAEANKGSWKLLSRTSLDSINPQRQAHISSNQSGDRVVVSGWENTSSQYQSPIMWRYEIPFTEAVSGENTNATVLDSLRMAPVEYGDASLSMSADESLNTIALAWQTHDTGSEQNSDGHAALSTYVFDDIAKRWLPALELPESMPTLAKQVFAKQLLISRDASSLFLASRPSSANPATNQAGQVRVLR